jgi:uncharacterized protein (TIGR02231 family)
MSRQFTKTRYVAATLSLALLVTAFASPSRAERLNAVNKTASGRVTHVTLYRGQAMITRTVPLDGEKAIVDLVVGDLPEQVVPDSLFAEAGDKVIVRAVRFRSRAVSDEPREEVRKLNEEIAAIREKIDVNAKNQQALVKRTAYLDQLEGFVAPTAKTDLSKGVLDAKSLQEITTFSFAQRKLILGEQITLEKEAKTLGEQLSLAERKHAEIAASSSKTVREAVVFLDKLDDGVENIRLNYLVNQAGWSPTYNFRSDKDRTKTKLEYNALIQQLTGEDWQDVNLTLSTASPALSSAGPGLAPFHVSLVAAGTIAPMAKGDVQQQVAQVRGRQFAANVDNRNSVSFGMNYTSSWAINSAANDFQCLVLTNPIDALTAADTSSTDGEGPNLSYALAGTVSLASRSDQQMVRIVSSEMKSQFYHVATPLLTSYVYREAELTNDGNEDLLAGPINVYLDGRFVGRGEIPTVARGQNFVVGFGADPQLRARQELADKSDDVQGGNRQIEMKYRLVIENYKQETANVRVFDRLPYSDRASDVRVTLSEGDDAISQDKVYQRRERPKGILRWDIEVPAKATADNAKMVEYTVRMEFDRNMQLTMAAAEAQQQMQEFEKLQRDRLKR